tara:strand:+ start:43 stop:267 length:225 start_codon:yes stop_codon:yes gene_type:complete
MTKEEELQKQIDNNYLVPIDSLYQYMTKEHLDQDNELTQEQWETFVFNLEDVFADKCSEIAFDLFNDYDEKDYE